MNSIITKIAHNKKASFLVSILLDALGFVSFSVPYFGEFSDVIWAPIAAYVMAKMYPDKTGRIASIFVFLEEVLPFLDVIPSFTIMWVYKYVIKK